MLMLAGAREGTSPGLVLIVQFAAIIAIFYFLLIRPQRKLQEKHRQMIAALKRGDEVMTDGGIIGEVVHLADERITVKSGESRFIVSRAKIARVLTTQTTTTT